ncbi:MAG TPA: HD domain-containing phosphohydrolase [Acidimicrobiia bacterium]|nr:HD domain-containing phosphohydrolase [Acidimicrobiia bacterium]
MAPALGVWLIAESAISIEGVALALLAMLLGSLVAPSVSSGNRLTLSISVAAALPFIFTVNNEVDLSGVIGIYLLGSVLLVGLEIQRLGRFKRAFSYAARHLIGYSSFALVFALVRSAVGSSLGDSGWEVLIPFGAGALAWSAVEVSLWSVFASASFRVSARYLALSEIKDANVFISLVATGALFGLMFDRLRWWALPVALLPYSFAHGAFKRFQETRTTYRQTIRALAQIPEAAGLSLRGHSDRTSELAVAMAKDLGLSPEEVEDVEFAALMHDIGHITLNDPMVVEQGWSEEDLARWGAEIIAGAPSLDRVAGYVRRQYEPFRNPGERSDPTVPTIARIIKVASAYDAQRAGNGASRLEALEHLHQGAAYDYDPEVVDSLRRVLESEQPVTV